MNAPLRDSGRDKWIFAGLTVLVFLFSLWALNMDDLLRFVRFFVFQVRDLERGQALAHGQLIFFGPETTGGGNLPGPFYYVLLMIASWFGSDWLSSFFLMVVTFAAAAAAGWAFFAKRVSMLAALLWTGLFLLSAPLENFIGVFLNVSFQCLFLVLMLICICEAFAQGAREAREKALFGAMILGGLTIQLHYSALMLVLAVLVLQIFARFLRVPRFEWPRFLQGAALFFLPLLPYFLWLSGKRLGYSFGQAPVFAGEVKNALPSMLAFSEWPPLDRILHGLDFLINGVPLALFAGMAAYLAAPWVRRWSKASAPPPAARSPYVIPLLVCAGCAIIPALYVFIAPIGYRYGMAFTLSMLMLTALLLSERRSLALNFVFVFLSVLAAVVLASHALIGNGWRDLQLAFHSRHWVAAAALLVVCLLRWKETVLDRSGFAVMTAALLLALVQNPSLWTGDLANHEMAVPPAAAWRRIGQILCDRTGWTWQESFERLYFVGGHMEMDPRPILRKSAKECKDKPAPPPLGAPSGYFLTFTSYLEKSPSFKDWLLQQPVAEEIKQGIQNGALELDVVEEVGPVAMIGYRVTDLATLPGSFHNIGVGYLPSPQQNYLRRQSAGQEVTRLDGGYLLTWNECPGASPYCLTGAEVLVSKAGGKTRLRVSLLGDSLSQNSPWITPTWTLAWNEPYLEVRCGQKTQRIVLAKKVGFGREYGYLAEHYAFYLGNHSFLTPYRRTIEVACDVEEFAIGRQSAVVEQLQSQLELPAERRSVSLRNSFSTSQK